MTPETMKTNAPPYVAMILNNMTRYTVPPCLDAATAHMTAQNSMYAMSKASSIAAILYFHRALNTRDEPPLLRRIPPEIPHDRGLLPMENRRQLTTMAAMKYCR